MLQRTRNLRRWEWIFLCDLKIFLRCNHWACTIIRFRWIEVSVCTNDSIFSSLLRVLLLTRCISSSKRYPFYLQNTHNNAKITVNLWIANQAKVHSAFCYILSCVIVSNEYEENLIPFSLSLNIFIERDSLSSWNDIIASYCQRWLCDPRSAAASLFLSCVVVRTCIVFKIAAHNNYITQVQGAHTSILIKVRTLKSVIQRWKWQH